MRSLALFGSSLRDTFLPDSDIDAPVEFEPERCDGAHSSGGRRGDGEQKTNMLGCPPVDSPCWQMPVAFRDQKGVGVRNVGSSEGCGSRAMDAS